jgi:hypothetical protein
MPETIRREVAEDLDHMEGLLLLLHRILPVILAQPTVEDIMHPRVLHQWITIVIHIIRILPLHLEHLILTIPVIPMVVVVVIHVNITDTGQNHLDRKDLQHLHVVGIIITTIITADAILLTRSMAENVAVKEMIEEMKEEEDEEVHLQVVFFILKEKIKEKKEERDLKSADQLSRKKIIEYPLKVKTFHLLSKVAIGTNCDRSQSLCAYP